MVEWPIHERLVRITKRYDVHNLVHYEFFNTMPEAIAREKQLKKWSRAKKIELGSVLK